MKREPLLRIQDLEKNYGGRKVVDGLSFEVYEGEIVGLLGANGAGKTTAFYMTMGLIRPDKGRVIFKKIDITDQPIHVRARLGMGYLAQEPSIFRHLTVEENILCILEILPLTRHEREERLETLLKELRLEKLAHKKAEALSGGERRRLEITRALVTNPSFLLLDEPFANIDPLTIYDVQEMILHLSKKGITVLITDHNAREIFSIAHRSYLVSEGKILLSGSAQELTESVQARQSYLGLEFRL